MPRYDRIFGIMAERIVAQGVIDIEAFIALLVESNVSEDRVVQMLIEDFLNNGPVLGAFGRRLEGAAGSSVMAAVRQGEMTGHVAQQPQLRRLSRLANLEGSVLDALEGADPEAAARLEDEILPEERFTWVSELVRTCPQCLPLHGTTMTMAEWRARGLLPENIHAGWDNPCNCRLVPAVIAENHSELVAPLKRVKLKTDTGLKGQRTTERRISQNDIDKALAARDAALETKAGRRTLRLLGEAGIF